MPFFQQLFHDHPLYGLLALLQGALTIWMLLDCRRREQDYAWFWVILWFQPLGAWAYFLAVKRADYRLLQGFPGAARLAGLFQNRASLDELRYKAEHIPTLANRVALAERLIEQRSYEEAIPHLEGALKTEPDHGQVLYSLALCQVRLGRPDQGTPRLERLVARDPRWGNYAAWRLLIEARVGHGDAAGALAGCRELLRLEPTLQNHCLLAEHLIGQGQADEARRLLEGALRDHDYAPGPVRRRNRRWASQARQILKGLDSR
jgi:hypothetical protein